MKIVRVVDYSLYPRKCIESAIKAYAQFCIVETVPLSNQQTRLTISPTKDIPEGEVREVLLGFLNYALDSSAEIRIEED